MTLATIVALVAIASLNAYLLMGGADFGGGVWDLLASGPRRAAQRERIAATIGPIWEANHVWLILVIVVLFTAFPSAFSALATVLHVPLVLMLIGIVMRGSAFVFRAYDTRPETARRRWGPAFAVASLVTPLLLGVCLGTVASGRAGAALVALERGERGFAAVWIAPWLAPFPLAVGCMTLALVAFLAAVYLTLETANDTPLQEDFRRRALGAAAAVFLTAGVALVLAPTEPSRLHEGLLASWWAPLLHVLTGIAALIAIGALVVRRYRLARLAAAAQASLILWGWAAAQYPRLVPDVLTIDGAAAPAVTLRALLWAVAAGAVLLIPSLAYLFRVFRGAR